MITFWVSWCPDCKRDLPQKKQFYNSLENDDLVFLTINVTGRETSSDAGPHFIEKFDLNFPVLIDDGRKVYDLFGCKGVPTTLLLDENHHITHKFDDKASFFEVIRALSMIMK